MVQYVRTTPTGLTLTVRSVQQADAAALHRACWSSLALKTVEDRITRWLTLNGRGHAWGLAAETDGQVVGVGLLIRRPGGAEICDLVVAEPWRGRGIGTALICALLAQAHEQHIDRVEIGGAVSNPRAVALYKRLGFRHQRIISLDLGSGLEPVIYLIRSSGGPCPADQL